MKENDSILTHYQRAFKEGILLRQKLITTWKMTVENLFDKSYMFPGISTGNFKPMSRIML